MRSRDDEVPRWAGVERGLRLSLCGIGGRLEEVPPSLAAAVVRTHDTSGERAARRLARFAAVLRGAEVWTRDTDDGFHRGVLTGDWRYDPAPEAAAADLVHVRSCDWTEVPDSEVPHAVRATFARGGRNFQRITAL